MCVPVSLDYMKGGEDVPAPGATTALGFDIGLLCTACVKVRGEEAISFHLLNRPTSKKLKLELLQDELLEWAAGPDIQGALVGVDCVCIEKHYAGMRPTHTQMKLRTLEFTLRQYFREKGFKVRMVWAATYKKHFRVCAKKHAENKKIAKRVAELHVLNPKEHPKIADRIHDLGDAYMVALYGTGGILRWKE